MSQRDESSSSHHDDSEAVVVVTQQKTKIRVMEASGQSESDRRQLRQSYRKLTTKISQKVEEIENPDSETFGNLCEKNNALFGQVRYTREAVLDGESLNQLASGASKQLDRLVEVPRYDVLRLTEKLRSKCCLSNGSMDWLALGKQAGACFNAVPARVQFLAGPLDAGYTPRPQTQRRRRVQEEEEEEEEEEDGDEEDAATKENSNSNQLSAVERNIRELSNVLRKECSRQQKRDLEELETMEDSPRREAKRKRMAEVNMVKLLFNPKSFTQTVENLFHTSFLVKNGQAKLSVREDGPTIKLITNRPDVAPPPKQSIISLTMKDWRELTKSYRVEESKVPHRRVEKQTKNNK